MSRLMFMLALYLVLGSWGSRGVFAQCTGAWLPGEGNPALFNDVRALATWDPDGAGPQPPVLVAGGTFFVQLDQGVTIRTLAAWDGVAWRGFPGIVSGSVNALTVHNGELVVGGSFSVQGVPGGNIAVWNGTTWRGLAMGVGGTVYALGHFGPDLIAGGQFSIPNVVGAAGVARWDGTAWHALGNGVSGTVRAVKEFNGELYVGGQLSVSSAPGTNNIAAWNGSAWHAVQQGASGPVNALEVYNGALVVGGSFQGIGGQSIHSLAVWNGSASGALGPAWATVQVLSLHVLGNDLIVGGAFSQAGGGVPARNVARFNGSTWSEVGSGMSPSISVQALGEFGGELIEGAMGGNFPHWDIMRVHNGAWSALGPGLNDAVLTVEPFEGDLILGGLFRVGGGDVEGGPVVRWDGASLSPVGAIFGYVYDMTVFNGQLVAVGGIGASGVPSFYGIARFNGAAWEPMGAGFSSSFPYAVTVHQGQLYVGGTLLRSGTTDLHHIARWDGAAWQPVGGGFDGSVRCLLSTPDGLVASGDFTIADGAPALHIAIWDGAAWHPLGAGFDGADDTGPAALILFEGQLLAGGAFTTSNALPVRGVARWDGTTWQQLGAGLPSVAGFTIYDGALIAVGGFTVSGGAPANNVARWDGAAWQPLGAGTGRVVMAAGVFAGELVVGGPFTSAAGAPSSNWARWSNTGVPHIVRQPQDVAQTCPGPAAFSIGVTPGYAGVTYQWRHDGHPVLDGFNSYRSISGATTPTLTFSATGVPDSGAYDCVVTSACGSVTSAAATIHVCPVEFNCDGVVNSQDFFDFLTAFFQADIFTDINFDGVVNSQDFFDFLAVFFAGC